MPDKVVSFSKIITLEKIVTFCSHVSLDKCCRPEMMMVDSLVEWIPEMQHFRQESSGKTRQGERGVFWARQRGNKDGVDCADVILLNVGGCLFDPR
jgi:hypothetical protein